MSYLVFPLEQRSIRWCHSLGLVPIDQGWTRLPSLAEIRASFDALQLARLDCRSGGEGTRFELWSTFNRHRGTGTTLHVKHDATGWVDKLTFDRGAPTVVVQTVAEWTRRCGNLVLVETGSSSPLVVEPGIDVETALTRWPIAKVG